jgi:hypothetical protein
MEHKQLEQTRAIMATKKEENLEDQYKGPNYVVPEEVTENVRSIQVEVSQSTIFFQKTHAVSSFYSILTVIRSQPQDRAQTLWLI